jgi:Spy/CpxP family protein refolding chaperone
MKTNPRILTLLAFGVLAVAPVVRADDADKAPPPPRDHPRMAEMREKRLKQLDEKLHLTDDQKARIGDIWDKAAQQAKADREAARDEAKDRRAQRRDMMKATHDQVRAVLTPEQQKIFDELPPPRPPRHHDGGDDAAH